MPGLGFLGLGSWIWSPGLGFPDLDSWPGPSARSVNVFRDPGLDSQVCSPWFCFTGLDCTVRLTWFAFLSLGSRVWIRVWGDGVQTYTSLWIPIALTI